jgi:NAD(P)-dependent dehydrogenase (short-subunit alcohol dehydrogenase family)
VTGAGGTIGPDLAGWLARCGAPRVVLVGRRGPGTAGVGGVAAALAAAGTEVVVAACDLTDREQTANLLRWAERGGPAWKAVIHAAVADKLKRVAEAALPDLALALGAKARGAAVLDELTAGLGLESLRVVFVDRGDVGGG